MYLPKPELYNHIKLIDFFSKRVGNCKYVQNRYSSMDDYKRNNCFQIISNIF